MLIEPRSIGGSGGGASAFIDLTDGPGTIEALKVPRGNAGATALEWYAPTDTPFAMAADWVNVKTDYNAAGVITTTTLAAQLNSGLTSATLTDASSYAIGHGMAIPGAGVAGAELVVTLTGVSGNVVSWSGATSTTVAIGATVYHDDTVAIKAAIATGLNVYAPLGDYYVLGGAQTEIQMTSVAQIVAGGGVDFRTLTSGTIIWTRSTTANVFRLKGENCMLTNLTIAQEASISPTAGAAVVLGELISFGSWSYHLRLLRVGIRNTYDGVKTEYATGSWVDYVYVNSPRRYGFYFNSPAPSGGNWYSNLQTHLRGDVSWKASTVAGFYFENLDTSKFNHIVVTGFKSNIHYNANNNIPGYSWSGGAPGCYQNIWTNVNCEIPYDSTNFMVKIEGSYAVERVKFTGIEFESAYVGSNAHDVGFTAFTIPWPANGKGFEIYGKGTHICSGDVTLYTGVTNYFGIKIGAAAVSTRVNNVRVVGLNSASISSINVLEIISGATKTIIGDNDFSNGQVVIGTTTAEEMTIRNNSRFHNNLGLNSYGSSITYTPGWGGQEVLVGSTFYRAAGVSSTADWKALN